MAVILSHMLQVLFLEALKQELVYLDICEPILLKYRKLNYFNYMTRRINHSFKINLIYNLDKRKELGNIVMTLLP